MDRLIRHDFQANFEISDEADRLEEVLPVANRSSEDAIPAESSQVNDAQCIEEDTFLLQKLALELTAHTETMRTDLALGVDDSLPWHFLEHFFFLERCQGSEGKPHHLSRAASRNTGNLSVGGDPTGRHLAYDIIDQIEQAWFFFHHVYYTDENIKVNQQYGFMVESLV